MTGKENRTLVLADSEPPKRASLRSATHALDSWTADAVGSGIMCSNTKTHFLGDSSCRVAATTLIAIGTLLLVLGCGGEASKCERALSHATDCGADVSEFTCPEDGKADALQDCLYDAYLDASCVDYQTKSTKFQAAIELCVMKFNK